MLLLESSVFVLLEGGVDRLTEETPVNTGAINLEAAASRVLLEDGTSALIREQAIGSLQTLTQTATIASTASLFAPNVKQVVTNGAPTSSATFFGPTVTSRKTLTVPLVQAAVPSTAVKFTPFSSERLQGPGVAADNNYTISGFVYIDTARVGSESDFIEVTDSAGSYQRMLIDSADGLTVRVGSNTGGTPVATLAASQWYFFAFTVTSGYSITGYVAAMGAGSMTASTPISAVSGFTPNALWIGSSDIFGTTIDGRIAHVRAWNRVLTTGELDLERASVTGVVNTTSLLGSWPLLSDATKLTAAVGSNLTNPASGTFGTASGLSGPNGATVAYSPSVVSVVTVPFISSGSALFAPSLANLNTLTVPQIASGATVFAGSVTNLNTLTAPFISSGSATFAPNVIQIVTPGFLASTETIYPPVVSQTGGTVTLLPPLLASTETLFAPTITTANTLTIPLLGSSSTTFAPNVVQVVSPGFLASSSTTFAPSVAQIVAPGLLGPGSTLFAPTLSNLNTLTAPFISSGSAPFAPVVTQAQSIIPPLLSSSAALFAPSLANLNILTSPLVASTATIFGPSVVQVVSPSLLSSSAAIFAPSVVQVVSPGLSGPSSTVFAPVVSNLNTLTAPFISAGSATFAPSVVQVVSPSLLSSSAAIFAPTVTTQNTLTAPLIASGSVTFAPSVVQVVAPSLLTSGAALFAPNLTQTVSPGLLGPGSTLFAPNLTNLNVLTAPFIGSGSTLYPPTVTGLGLGLYPPTVGPSSTLFAPTITTANGLTAPFISSGAQTFAPRVVQVLSPPAIAVGSQIFAPSVTQNVAPGLIGPNSVVFSPSLLPAQPIVAPFISSAATLFAPAASNLNTLAPPVINSTETVFAPRVVNTGELRPPFIPSSEQVFAPSAVQIVSVPFIGSVASIGSPKVIYVVQPPRIASAVQVFAPVLERGVGYPQEPVEIPLIHALELPLPNTLTRITGIHQSDVIIRSAIVAALADMRANPWLLDYVFASLPQDPLTWKEYGEKDLQQARQWFVNTNIPVSVLPRMDESKFPQITIELQESTEVVPETTLGDVNYETDESNDMTWPALTPVFTPISYTPSTGTVRLSTDAGPLIAKGMFIVDRQGGAHEIIYVTSQSEFKIDPGTIADLRGCVLKGHRPNWKVDIESSSFRESYRLGIHISGEPAHLTWLHAIVQFALMRYKQVLMEARGFERSTISSSQISRAEWSEAENVFSRYITITGYVRQYWPKTIAQVIDGVEFEGLQVSGQGADVQMAGTGTNPDDSLWIGNLDSLRTRR